MRRRLVRGLVFLAVALGVAVGASSAAGAADFGSRVFSNAGVIWD